MTPERQELAFEIFDAAIARPEAERERFVAQKCVDDQELGGEVRSLLAAHADASGFLSRRAQSTSGPMIEGRAPASPALQTGDRLGAFLIENFLGAYAAARDGQKFLILEPDRSGGESLTFVLDWPARTQPK